MSTGTKYVTITIKANQQPKLITNFCMKFDYNTTNGLVTNFYDFNSGESKDITKIMGDNMIYNNDTLNNFVFTYNTSNNIETLKIMYDTFGCITQPNTCYDVTYIDFSALAIIKHYNKGFFFDYKQTISDKPCHIEGPKYINITLEKQVDPAPVDFTKQDLLNPQICLQFYYYIANGKLSDLKWYNPDSKDYEDIWHLVLGNPVFVEGDPNNPLSIVYLSSKPYYGEAPQSNIDLMKKIFGIIRNNTYQEKQNEPVGNVDLYSSGNSVNFYAIDKDGEYVDGDEYKVKFDATINTQDKDCLPKYINIKLEKQLYPDPSPIQDLLKTSICLQFFYDGITGNLTKLDWFNPDTKKYEDIWHLVKYKPVFDQSDPNGESLIVTLSSKPDDNINPTQPNIELMQKIFGIIHNNDNYQTDKPVGIINFTSIDKRVSFNIIDSNIPNYQVNFEANIPITDIEIECEPKYLNITLNNQNDPLPPPEQTLLKKQICLKFSYYKDTNIKDFFWFNPLDNTYQKITQLLYKYTVLYPFPPTFDGTNISPVYFSWFPTGTDDNKKLMKTIFGSIYITNNNNPSQEEPEPVGLFQLYSANQLYSFDEKVIFNVIIDNGNLKDFYTVKFQPDTILITDTNSCCFSEGTKILSLSNQQPIDGCLTSQLKEEYRLVQDLIIGDFVKTYLHGYRKVSRVISGNFVNNPKDEGVSNCMYRMLKTEDNGLIEDLTLTRNHGVLVDKLTENEEKKVDKNNLPVIDNLLSIITADSDKFQKVLDTNVYKYYHFSLETDGDEDRRFGVYANGILVEVPSNNMMDNALNVKPLDF